MATASAVGVPGLIVEMQFSGSTGAWTDITGDVLSGPGITVSYGIHGVGPADRVADTGTMNFFLNNAQDNSAKLIGYYSPGHNNSRSGFTSGVGARMWLIYSG